MSTKQSVSEAEAFAILRQHQDTQLEDDSRRSAVRRRLLETLHADAADKSGLAARSSLSTKRKSDEEIPGLRKNLWSIRNPSFTVGVGIAACAAAALLWVKTRSVDEPLTFIVAEKTQEAGRYLAAPDKEKMPLHFSDGSRVTLKPGTSARVEKLARNGATVRLEDGAADINVIHREDTKWKVEGGPYTVHVVGTRFRAEWDPHTRRFSVEMYDGEVRVQGPGLEKRGSSLRTGEKLVSKAEDRAKQTKEAFADSSKAGDEKEETKAAPQEAPAASPANQPIEAKTPREPLKEKNWLKLAQEGKHAEALANLSSESFAKALETRPGDELVQLGTTARLGGDRSRERRVYMAMRTRFAGTIWSAEAAFFLARLDQEVGSFLDAEQWLRKYRNEAGTGRWAEEAQGRLIEILDRSGRHGEAQSEAKDYLSKHPKGAYNKLSRSVLQKQAAVKPIPAK